MTQELQRDLGSPAVTPQELQHGLTEAQILARALHTVSVIGPYLCELTLWRASIAVEPRT